MARIDHVDEIEVLETHIANMIRLALGLTVCAHFYIPSVENR